ncbi:MAG: ABC transporter ATP-binding protein [Candidatus Neomarinimicrobiota bacterium]
MKNKFLLNIRSLTVSFPVKGDLVPVVDQVSFSISRGESVAVVGESGCGKSQIALALMGLTSSSGTINMKGQGLEVSKAMIFQEPMTALNPVLTIGEQIREAIPEKINRNRKKVIEYLNQVKIGKPEERYGSYPHEFSGGMRQRVLIAMALARKPVLLIADEPTTALDAVIRKDIILLLKELNKKEGLALLFITHDISILKIIADRILVMYAGHIVESGPTDRILHNCRHPYTKDLMALASLEKDEKGRFPAIPGSVPQPENYPSGCPYHPRCKSAIDICSREFPALKCAGLQKWSCIHLNSAGRTTN